MLPTSIAGSMRIGWPSTRSPASTVRRSARVNGKSRPGSTPRRCRSGRLAPVTYAPGRDALVEDDREVRPDGPEVARRSEALGDLVLVRGAHLAVEVVAELDVVDPVVAAHDDEHHALALRDDRERLQQRARRDAEVPGDGVDRRHAGGRDLLRRVERLAERDRLGVGARDLDVRGVPRGERDVVLAGRARRHVLVRAPCRPSCRRRTRPGTTRARCGRRSGRRPRCAARRRACEPLLRRGRRSSCPS